MGAVAPVAHVPNGKSFGGLNAQALAVGKGGHHLVTLVHHIVTVEVILKFVAQIGHGVVWQGIGLGGYGVLHIGTQAHAWMCGLPQKIG